MNKIKISVLFTLMALCGCLFAACSSDDDDDANKQHDGTLYGEWLGTSGYYYKDYYYFSSDGTGEHGSYDVSIDESSVDEDFKWYTVNGKYLFINGTKYEYSCDGSSLTITGSKGTKTYRPKD